MGWITSTAVAAGLVATALWLYLAGAGVFAAVSVLAPSAAIALATVTTASVLMRFLRWHYILRRAGVFVPIRPSLSYYLASLAGIATPAYLGETVRCALLRRSYGVPLSRTLPLWLGERVLDFAAIASWVGVGYWDAPGAVWGMAVVAVALVGLSQVLRPNSLIDRTSLVFVPFALSLIAWLPVMSLFSIAAWGLEIGLDAHDGFQILGLSLIGGGVSLMPAGIGATGALAILQLEKAGVGLVDAVAVVAVVRVATVGLALGTGIVFLARALFRMRRSTEGSRSFDVIADSYLAQFSPHIWDLLIERKTARLREALGPPLKAGRGLDLGCGLGLQAAALRAAGYEVIGLDPAHRLLQHAVSTGVSGFTASALSIPIASDRLDFVYTVGVLHHLPSYAAQEAAFQEVCRVLKPGGVFIVMETNPRNPLFRSYMTYLFPLLRQIDEGIELWLDDERWTAVPGFRVQAVGYFTFLPDFLPRWLLRAALPVERFLERSALGRFSVHYIAVLRKTAVTSDALTTKPARPTQYETLRESTQGEREGQPNIAITS